MAYSTIENQQHNAGDGIDLLEVARSAAALASERKAADVIILDVKAHCSFADIFIIATCETERHIETLAERLTRHIRAEKLRINHREGLGTGGWVLLDFPSLIIHLMGKEARARYNLEERWAEANTVLHLI